ncbi:MAG: carbohydrate ABC transporter permease [Fournierella sp.]|uniref:carbohydrate ABC transporter permease n=1 Tax=Allofournierella sp. TaxID=1940256 RepID=UPI002A82956F|nr:carbohydrate ABC transporter permease [Fournierella sp.]MDY4165924.1 carbohydrate ABC transporter permease [Fournierella sp.]
MIGKKINVSKVILTIVFWAIGLTMLVPLIWMISTACKIEADVFNFPIEWIPRRWNLVENMKEVWGGRYNFGLYYLNSIKVTVLATFFQVLVSALGAYGFSKIRWKGRDKIFLAYLATMMIPPQVTIVSQFIIMRNIGLYNTHTGLILMLAFSVYGVFLLRQAMMAVPESLSESARIDGAGHVRIFFQIVLPMIKPSLATLATLKFVWTWNDYQAPLIFLNDRNLYTIQLGMKQFASESGSYYSLIMAAAVSAILPLVIVFLFCQRFVVDGIATGAVKG